MRRWLVVGLLGAACAAGVLLRQAIRSWPEFAVQDVRVTGTEVVGAAQVRALANIAAGTNIWDVDLEAVRARVRQHAWIADADVRRWLPNSVVVAVEEHRPIAVLPVGGTPWAVDGRGELFAPLPTEAARELTQITGMMAVAAEAPGGRTAYLLRRVAALHHLLHRHHSITEVHVDETRGVTVRARDLGDVPIHLGWGHWRRKCRRLEAVLALWRGREHRLDAVSLAFNDEVVVRVRPGTGTLGPGARAPERGAEDAV